MADCQGQIPGPSYALGPLTGYDNHDYTKKRAPAFSLGLRTYPKTVQTTPGPYNVGGVDRHGKYGNLGWTMESNAVPTAKPIGPGPQSYAPEKVKSYTPAYSLGLKIPGPRVPFGPSAAEYFPQYPNQGGFTIGHAWKNLTPFVPPGPKPAVPTNMYKRRAPAYSLGLRGRSIFQGTIGPGPKYYPGRVCPQVPHAYSFGMKHARCAPPLITREDKNW